jgi:hypothetical protein
MQDDQLFRRRAMKLIGCLHHAHIAQISGESYRMRNKRRASQARMTG